MHIFDCPNVTVSPHVAHKDKINYPANKANLRMWSSVEKTVAKLARLYPQWEFEATEFVNTLGDTPMALHVKVIEDGEELGTITRTYHGRDYVIAVANERIEKSMERGTSYKTSSPDKAVAKVRKMFSKSNTRERLDKASKMASDLLYTQVRRMDAKEGRTQSVIQTAALTYIMNTGYPQFLAYLNSVHSAENKELLKRMEDSLAEKADMLSIQNMRDKHINGKSALVIKDKDKYIVRIGDSVNLYDDATIPQDLRGNLGLLKLIEKDHFVSDVGCKVSDEVFVVIPKTQE